MPRSTSLVLPLEELLALRDRMRAEGRSLVFTNGCFDLLHRGHVEYLAFARAQGDALVVAINSDASVRRLKGPSRPVNAAPDRAAVLRALRSVDHVVVFDEDEPRALIERVLPDVLVKGSDWAHYVSGREAVEAAGGRVVLADLVPDRSSSGMMERVRSGRGIELEASGVCGPGVPPGSSSAHEAPVDVLGSANDSHRRDARATEPKENAR